MCAMRVKVVVHDAEEGGFWAEAPALPGCVSQGDTMDELLANIGEAIEAWLEAEPPSEKGDDHSGQGRVVELSL
jgi:predicted RNase H-like HicB family nuclease